MYIKYNNIRKIFKYSRKKNFNYKKLNSTKIVQNKVSYIFFQIIWFKYRLYLQKKKKKKSLNFQALGTKNEHFIIKK